MLGRITLATLALVAGLAPLAASAGEVGNRIQRENQRINAGVANGQLTHREYNQLDHRSDRINAARARDLRANNGSLTVAEKRRLNARENGLSDAIYYDKHNRAHQH